MGSMGSSGHALDPEQVVGHPLRASGIFRDHSDSFALALVGNQSHEIDDAVFRLHFDREASGQQ